SVVLFDEIEKAHPDIFNILLQILEEGTLTDTHGRKVDFRDTIIIMTSNLGARELQKGGKVGFAEDLKQIEAGRRERAMDALKKQFSPEFLNRIDEIVFFNSLNRDQIKDIVNIMVARINDQLFDRRILIEINDEGREFFADVGFDDKFGARPLRRALQREVEDHLATRYLEGAFREPTKLLISSVIGDDKKRTVKYEEQEWTEYESLFNKKREERAQKEAQKKEKEAAQLKLRITPIRTSPSSAKPANSGQLT
ncbi:MAG: ATP-dependent Clp protease ATP-binding subunit, partial [Leptonema sp. (in: Bacteria)]|nr:ATP-dependent Clp protease ATP-binding subunit [Leptonema sp. (in: bacteria)]